MIECDKVTNDGYGALSVEIKIKEEHASKALQTREGEFLRTE